MSKPEYQAFTDAEMDITRQTNLPELLSSLGYDVVRKGSYHSIRDMPHIMIKAQRRFYDNYERRGGDALDFLQHYHNMSFPEATHYLLSFHGHARDAPISKPPTRASPPVKPPEPVPFELPEKNVNYRRMYAYLSKRGIARQVIDGFVYGGFLYEDAKHRNCVFVGKNKDSKPVFAYKRGTYDKDGASFKGDVAGSDTSVAFRLHTTSDNLNVYVFESPIDLMSYTTLHRNVTHNAIALCCLDDGALDTYLSDYPHIAGIFLCLDSDKWGKQALERMEAKYDALGYIVNSELPPKGKDWNEYLQLKKNKTHHKEK